MDEVTLYTDDYKDGEEGNYQKYCEMRNLEELTHCASCEREVLFAIICEIKDKNQFYTILQCPKCHKIYVQSWKDYGDDLNWVPVDMVTYPQIPARKMFEKVIEDISSDFVEIYNQAAAAEAYGLDQITGIGYRKSMEFLVKDYAKKNYPEETNVIEKKPLAKCIEDYILEPKIKIMAKAAVWLGNDETHYVKKWIDKDIKDLKMLIDLTLHWINYEKLTEEYKKSMNISD